MPIKMRRSWTHTTTSSLGKRLRECRVARGWMQEEVAAVLGVTKTSISNYECDRQEPPGDRLVQLANLYNVTTDALLGRHPMPKQEPVGMSAGKE